MILIDEQQTGETHGIVAQMPTGGIVIGSASEGATTKDEEIAAALQIAGNGGPSCFGNDGALRKNEQPGLRIIELRGQLLG